jgi:hypothetical protein
VEPASFYRRLDVHLSSPMLDCCGNIAAPLVKTQPVGILSHFKKII